VGTAVIERSTTEVELWQLVRKTMSTVNLSVEQDGELPVLEFRKYWTQKLALLKYECHTIMNKYPETASIVQQVRKVLSGIGNLAGCTPLEEGESSEWTSILNSVENRANFYKAVDDKWLFSDLYGMYA
jgi:hypothetical protein